MYIHTIVGSIEHREFTEHYLVIKDGMRNETRFCTYTSDHLHLLLETAATVGKNRTLLALLEGVSFRIAQHSQYILA